MRRFDKNLNIQKANLLSEQRYLESKGLISESVNMNEWDYDLKQMYTESFKELDIRVNGVLLEGKDLLDESLGFAAISGAVLASGKFLDIIGSLARKFQNWAVKKGYLKGDAWDKTKFEKWGEGLNKVFLSAIFKPLAGFLLAPIAAIVIISGGNGESVMSHMDRLANTLFSAAIIILFGVNAYSIVKDFAHLDVLTSVIEGISQSTKFYELILLCVAFFIYKKVGNESISETAHSLGECLEGGGDYGKLMSSLKELKDKSKWETLKLCIVKSDSHH